MSAALTADHAPAAQEMAECFHCGVPVVEPGRWAVTVDGVERSMCCPGCQAVARTIVDSGCADYYRNRTALSGSVDKETLIPDELLLYDTPEAIVQFTAAIDEGVEICEATFSVEGIRCAACVWLIERRLAGLPGVRRANLNVATERLYVQWIKDRCKPSEILKAAREVGYAAYPFDASRHGEQLRHAGKRLFRQLFVAGLSMMQVMMYAVPAYLATDGTLDEDAANLMRWASLLLTLPAVCYSALPFFQGAWANLKSRMLGMDVPVALGIAAAFTASLAATWRGQGEVYFDSVTMFIFLLLCSRYIELVARRKAASALERLQHALPASAARMAGYPASRDTEMVPAGRLKEGDVILVKPGESIPADGVIIEGETGMDVSLLTGESRILQKLPGDLLPGGAVNVSQAIVVRVSKAVRDSTLSALLKLIESVGQAKPQIALWADRVAAWFVAALLLFAAIVFGIWAWVDPSRAWPIVIAVLVVSCPCALSLATPTALAAATDRLVRQGVLVVRPHVLETLHRATHIVFDKTGTLTIGKPTVEHVAVLGNEDVRTCLSLAAALEASSAHPIGLAITDAARKRDGALPGGTDKGAGSVRYFVGRGLEGTVDGVPYRLGSAAFVEEITHTALAQAASAEGLTPVYLGRRDAWLARFDVADPLRDDAHAVVANFRGAGKTVVLLSGDDRRVTQRVAEELGIDCAYAERLPEQKLAYVQGLQKEGAVVAMIGDGINDAAVLRAADVSFAMGSGAALAQVHADTVLISGRIRSVWETARLASRTMAVIRQNLAWAAAYNALAIPAASLGLLNPWLCGVGMSLSSAIVVANALRLRRESGLRKTHMPAARELAAQGA